MAAFWRAVVLRDKDAVSTDRKRRGAWRSDPLDLQRVPRLLRDSDVLGSHQNLSLQEVEREQLSKERVRCQREVKGGRCTRNRAVDLILRTALDCRAHCLNERTRHVSLARAAAPGAALGLQSRATTAAAQLTRSARECQLCGRVVIRTFLRQLCSSRAPPPSSAAAVPRCRWSSPGAGARLASAPARRSPSRA